MYDVVIKGGRVYDGSGQPAFTADVAIEDGKIAVVGRVDSQAKRTIDADGLAVSPGFIDFHTHLDAQLFWDPLGSSLNEHGVTTVVTGNCGLTLAPCKPEDRDAILSTFIRVEAMPRKVMETAIPWEWTDHAGYIQALAKRPLGVNVATFIGHCAVRQYAMGDDCVERAATEDEVRQMEGLVRDGMNAGAFGFSTNLNNRHFREDGKPVPSRLAERSEIDRLCHVVGDAQRGVIQFTSGSLNSIKNMPWYRELAKATKRPLVWQSVAHRWNAPDMWRQQLSDAEQAFREGAAAYPITNARPFSNRWTMKNSQRFTEMPTWNAMMWLPEKQRKEAMRDPATRKKLTFEATQDTTLINFSRRWDLVYIREVVLDRNRPWVDKSVAEYAAAQGKPVIDAFLDLALEEDLDTLFENSDLQGDPDAVGEILRSPYVLIGQSDAGAHVQYDAGFGYCTRLLGYYVRDRQALALENAIRKLTFMPASVFGIRDRGLLRPGMNADVTVFDPTTVAAQERELVHDMPGGEPRYVQHARGVNSTIVNGEVLMEGGGHTGAYPGRVLRSA